MQQFVPTCKGHQRADESLHVNSIRRQTTAHEQRASQGRQVYVCKGHQRADECLHVKGIRRQTGAHMQRQSQGRHMGVCMQRASEGRQSPYQMIDSVHEASMQL